MTFDIVDVLKQKVSAQVLADEKDYAVEKSQALAGFYPILLALLQAKPGLIQSLQNQLNPRVEDLFSGNQSLKQQMLQHLSPTIPIDQTEKTLSHAIAPSLTVLEHEAGSSNPDTIAHFLTSKLATIQAHLPTWAVPILAALGVNHAQAQPVHHRPVEPVKEEKKSGFLLPLIAFLILAGLLAFLFKACNSQKTQPVVVASNQTASESARFQLNTGATGDLVTCQIYLNQPKYMQILQNEVKQIFNQNNGCGADGNAMYGTEFMDQDLIPTVLKHIKGVPNTNIDWQGNQLSIQSANPTDAQNLADKIKPLLKNVSVMVAPAVAAMATDANAVPASTAVEVDRAVNDSISQAGQALSNIDRNNVTALDVATALNLQIINFASASSVIPESNKLILDQAAGLMKGARHVVLNVEGHTDSTGNAAANKTLSLQRAQAVVKYLVGQGVNPNQLKALGFGQEQPIADNATESGKFRNRRIEFEVVNTETGTVRKVDEQGVNKQP